MGTPLVINPVMYCPTLTDDARVCSLKVLHPWILELKDNVSWGIHFIVIMTFLLSFTLLRFFIIPSSTKYFPHASIEGTMSNSTEMVNSSPVANKILWKKLAFRREPYHFVLPECT